VKSEVGGQDGNKQKKKILKERKRDRYDKINQSVGYTYKRRDMKKRNKRTDDIDIQKDKRQPTKRQQVKNE